MDISQNTIIDVLKLGENITSVDSYIEIKHVITNEKYIKKLQSNNMFSDHIDDSDIVCGNEITLQFSKLSLLKYNIYYDVLTFVKNNKYSKNNSTNFIIEIDDFFENSLLYSRYLSIIKLIETLKQRATFNFNKSGNDVSFITNTKNGLELIYDYSVKDLQLIENHQIINRYCEVLDGSNVNEKEVIYLNELVDFLITKNENLSQFSFLIKNFSEYYKRCNDSFKYYLRDFNFNKLKFELDSKFTEFTDKIQKVVSEAQSKILIIPAALMLTLMNFEYNNAFSDKNIITVIGYSLMCVITQVLISNQKLQLTTIKEQVTDYESTLDYADRNSYSTVFHLKTRNILINQMYKVLFVQFLLWFILFFLIGLLFYFDNQEGGDFNLLKTYSLMFFLFIMLQIFLFPFSFFDESIFFKRK